MPMMKTFSKIAAAVILIAICAVGLNYSHHTATALSSGDFNPGRIIDDFVFENKSSMSVQDIQNFLNAKVPSCDTNGTKTYSYFYDSGTGRVSGSSSDGHDTWVTTSRAIFGQRYDTYYSTDIAAGPLVCLKSYVENTTTYQNNLHGASVSGGISAAQIIWNAAQAYNISPKVLIVTLQKEQGLVTDDWPWENQFQEAMGYMCPDTPQGCNSTYAGFYTQVTDAAWQFRYYLEHNGSPGNFWVGNYYIPYNPNSGCGGTVVNIQNGATAALYDYTPYQPNSGALAGLSDSSPGGSASCGAYGNRNFWWYFNTWFGSTYSNDTYTPHPNGTLVAFNNRVYLIENDQLRWITNADVFLSYGYSWSSVKAATTGDKKLTSGSNISSLAPGTLFYASGTPLYVMTFDSNGAAVKQQVSLDAFNHLGYKWSETMRVPAGEVPSASAGSIMYAYQHPAGTLITDKSTGKVYELDFDSSTKQVVRQYVFGPYAFSTNLYHWGDIKTATTADLSLSTGASLNMRQGTMVYSSGNLYLIDYDGSGIMKRPVGPWECYSNRWHYILFDAYSVPSSYLPSRTGPVATC